MARENRSARSRGAETRRVETGRERRDREAREFEAQFPGIDWNPPTLANMDARPASTSSRGSGTRRVR